MSQDQENELFRNYQEYLSQISESGVPLWVLDLYQDQAYYQLLDNEPIQSPD